MSRISYLFMAALLMSSCSQQSAEKTPRGFDTANLDATVSPKDDFYDYACGGWMKANPLKPEFSRYGTFDQLGELNRSQVRDLVMIEELIKLLITTAEYGHTILQETVQPHLEVSLKMVGFTFILITKLKLIQS